MEILTTVFSTVLDLGATTINWMQTYPITLVGVGFGFVGATIGLVKRAMRVGGRRR